MRRDPWLWLALGIGTALRGWGLGRPSLWLDEAISAGLATLPVSEIVRECAADLHPAGYSVLLHAWVQPWSGPGQFASESALRSLSLVCGVLTLPMVYALGLRAGRGYDPVPARWAVMLAALSPFAVEVSREARPYALLGLLGVAQWALWDRCHRTTAWTGPVGLGLLLGASLHVHYLAGLWWLGLSLAWVISERPRMPGLRRWLVATGIGGLLFAPWLPIVLTQLRSSPRGWLPFHHSPLLLLRTVAEFFRGGSAGSDELALWAVPITYLLVRGIRRVGWGPTLILGVPLAVAYAASFAVNLFDVRYFAPAAAAAWVGVAWGIAPSEPEHHPRLRRTAGTLTLAACVLGLAAPLVGAGPEREDWRGMVATLESRALPRSAVVFPFVDRYAPYAYYTRRDDLPSIPGLVDPGDRRLRPAPGLAGSIRGAPEVYYVEYLQDLHDPGRLVLARVREAGFGNEEALHRSRRLVLWRFQRTDGFTGGP